MRTNRMIRLALCLVAAALLLTACAKPASTPPAEEVVALVQQSQPFAEMTPLTSDILADYIGIPPESIAQAAASFDASRYTPEGIIVVTANNMENRKKIESALEAYRLNLHADYVDYQPQEAYKIDQAHVRSHGLQTALVIAHDLGLADKALDAAWK